MAHDPLKKMWIHQAQPTSQPYKVGGYVVQGTRLTVPVVRAKSYIICYNTVSKHLKWLYRLIPYIRGKGAITWPILSVGHLRFPPGYVKKERYDLRLKMIMIKY